MISRLRGVKSAQSDICYVEVSVVLNGGGIPQGGINVFIPTKLLCIVPQRDRTSM